MTIRGVALVAVLLVACSAPALPGDDGGAAAVLESREILGEPMVELATAVIALGDAVDQARHASRRGREMADDVEELATLGDEVLDAAKAAGGAAEKAPVEQAADVVVAAAAEARDAVAAAESEQSFLEEVAAIDTRLERAVTAWETPGSQSEIRERLGGVAADVAAQRKAVRALKPIPRRCTRLVRNRGEWVRTVYDRTVKLQAQANSAGGATFDELRAAYRRLPFGVEPRTADREDRRCWREESSVAVAAAQMRSAVKELERVLKG